MGSRSTRHEGRAIAGLAIPHPDCTHANLQSGATGYAVTEAGPIPGVPVPTADTAATLRSSGTVTSSTPAIDVRSQGGGLFLVRDDGDSNWSGHDPPGAMTGTNYLRASPTQTAEVIRLAAGKLLGIARTSTTLYSYLYDPTDGSTTETAVSASGWSLSSNVVGYGLAQMSDGTVLLYIPAQYADSANIDILATTDEGATWTVYALAVLEAPPAAFTVAGSYIDAAISGDEAVIIVESTTTDCAVYSATTPAGPYRVTTGSATADITNLASSPEARFPRVTEVPGGGFLYIVHGKSGSTYSWEVVRTSSGQDSLSNGRQAQELSAGTPSEGTDPRAAVWVGEDGNLWMLLSFSASANAHHGEMLHISRDRGETFVAMGETTGGSYATIALGTKATPLATDYLAGYGAADLAGRIGVLTRDGDGNSLRWVWLGGQSDHTLPRGEGLPNDFLPERHVYWGEEPPNLSGRYGGLWIANDAPDSMGWTLSGGAAGTGTLTAGRFVISTNTTQTRYYTRTFDDTDHTAVIAEATFSVSTGASRYGGIRIALSDYDGAATQTSLFRVSLLASATHYELYDEVAAATIGSAVALDMTTARTFRVAVDNSGDVRVWHCTPGPRRAWTLGVSSSGLTDDGAAPLTSSTVEFGRFNATSSTYIAAFDYFGFCFWPGAYTALATDTVAGAWSNPAHVRPFPITSTPRYIRAGLNLAKVDGADRYGDTWDVTNAHTYGVENLSWTVSPAPTRTWRSTSDGTDVLIAWDVGSSTAGRKFLGSTIGIFLARANFKTATLQRSTGGAFTTIGTMDLSNGLSGMNFTRTANSATIEAATGGTAMARYIRRGEFIGATMVLTNGGTVKYRKIAAHDSGAWPASGTTKTPRFWLEGIDGTEPTSGTADIWATTGAWYIHDETTHATQYALLIPAQTTADGYFECGLAFPFHVEFLGTMPSFGSSITARSGVVMNRDARGIPRPTRRAGAQRTLTMSWDEGVCTSPLYTTAPSPDYVVADTTNPGPPVATLAEVVENLEAMQSLALDGRTVPLVALRRIALGDDDMTATERNLIMLGHVGDTASIEPFTGWEGDDEVQRAGLLTIEEIPGCWKDAGE